MSEIQNNIVYSKQVLEFVTVATEYCNFIESVEKFTKKDFIVKMHKLLSYVYQKAVLLPELELIYDANQKFVTELDWNKAKDSVNAKLVSQDEFVSVENIEEYQEDTDAEYTLSELMADIYQELMDAISIYQIGNEEAMNDAIYDVKLSFEQFYGVKILVLLQAFHKMTYGNIDLSDEELSETKDTKINNDNWVNKQWE